MYWKTFIHSNHLDMAFVSPSAIRQQHSRKDDKTAEFARGVSLLVLD